MRKFLAPLAGVSLIVLAPAAASAQPAPAVQAADPAKLAEAHAIIAIMFPPAERKKMIDDMLTNLSAPMRKSLPLEAISDPGFKKLMTDFLDETLAEQRPLLQRNMPKMLDAMAIAYTHEFSAAELKDIHAFAQTPSGTHYFSRTTAIMGDPAVGKVMSEMMVDAQATAKPMLAGFKEKVIAYLKAHPDVAAKIEAEAKAK
jgi:hypothetical protein